jgi:AAA+ superfamily predicted ATPase
MQILHNRILAGYPGLILVTHEESRAIDLLKHTAEQLDRALYVWNTAQCLNEVTDRDDNRWGSTSVEDPIAMLEHARGMESCIILMQDMNLFLQDPNPGLYRHLKITLSHLKTKGITLVFTMPLLKLPPDLEKAFSVIDFELPDAATLTGVLDTLCHDPQDDGSLTRTRPTPTGDELDAILDAAAGLTCAEAEDAFALSLTLHGDFLPATILAEKAATLRKGGIIEYLEPKLTLADVGGWDAFKAWIHTSRHSFSKAASSYGLKPIKGLLLVGMGGCGKSLVAPIIGSVLNIPILRIDPGNLMGGIVGQTEGNWRSVINTALSLKKAGLYMDEVDGLFSGSQSSGKTDGGTTARLTKSILQDIQNSEGIFYIFTANDIDNIPDPLIDRLSVWFVDLPNDTERGEIFQIQMRHTGRTAQNVCPKGLMQVVKLTDGFSGRQIERVWLNALNLAFNDGQREPLEKDILEALKGEVPTSKTMATAIEARRKRLEGVAKPVTSITLAKVLTGGRKVQAAG